jgi:hypothetical protein
MEYPKSITERTTQFEITSIMCKLPLTDSDFNALVAIDYLDVVLPLLVSKGAENIEYNGHFGSNIYWQCDTEKEATEIIEAIMSLLP